MVKVSPCLSSSLPRPMAVTAVLVMLSIPSAKEISSTVSVRLYRTAVASSGCSQNLEPYSDPDSFQSAPWAMMTPLT